MKALKMIAVALAGIVACSTALHAQDTQQDLFAETTDTVEVKPYMVYCEIISYGRELFSNKTTIELDFGQASKFFSNDRKIVDEAGRIIKFNSMLDAMNFMAERGWKFEQAYTIQTISEGSTNTATYHWILSKEVRDPEEITEGLLTAKMKK